MALCPRPTALGPVEKLELVMLKTIFQFFSDFNLLLVETFISLETTFAFDTTIIPLETTDTYLLNVVQ